MRKLSALNAIRLELSRLSLLHASTKSTYVILDVEKREQKEY
jgi:hypothetical protein